MSRPTKSPTQFETASSNPDLESVTDVTAEELSLKLDDVHLIDVRRPDEYSGELGHIVGSELIVLDTLPEQMDELPKKEPIVFICRSGARSARAAAFAQDCGFEHVYNLKGGMIRWNDLGYPVER